MLAQKAEVVGNGHHFPGHVHPVPGLNNKVAIGDDHAPLPLHRGIQHPGNFRHTRAELAQGTAHHDVLLLGAEFHHFHLAPGEVLDIIGKGKAQQAADLHGGSPLGIDRHVHAGLVLEQGQACIILGVTDTGNGILRAQTLGNQAAEHIDFITGGGGHQDIRLIHPRVHEGTGIGAIALDAHHVQGILTALEHRFVIIDHHHIVTLTGQLLRQRMANLAVAHHQYPHTDSSNK